MLRASRNGPRICSSAITPIVTKPSAVAISEAARSSRVFPMPGSPSSVRPVNDVWAERTPCSTAASSSGRPTTDSLTLRT